ncbi:methionyl-tRNA formyltransferase [Marinomonas sp. A79]|uniref:Methionyl-tRNA formyltransferase n=1 Tax=Marinomonas vulgaris TaxID=2823372 RepID=A0ABS5HAV0_9GAMM|nr:methionyl-tRNA formyltransferase [Marinomonas vulgaris]MBR7888149.1 methionyl-tRNA formyltransferase [Marinomonas vulgaris]
MPTHSHSVFSYAPNDQSPLRIIFAGTPEFAAASLQALLDSATENHYQLVGVYTQPDRPAGRGQKLVQSPVKQLAIAHDIPVFQPLNFKQDEDKAQLANLNADLMIVAAYGIILPKVVLDTPKLGCINVHASLLPRWRGAAPIHRSLIAGDDETGITIMQMDVGLDTGDMLLKASCDIKPSDTSASLHDRLATLGGSALIDAIEKLKTGSLTAEKQDDNASCYAAKLTKQEANIDWAASAKQIERQIRGLSPWPVAYTHSQAGVMKIHAAQIASVGDEDSTPGDLLVVSKEGIIVATGQGAILITEVQFAGGKRMKIQDALNGKHKAALVIGQQFGRIEQTA